MGGKRDANVAISDDVAFTASIMGASDLRRANASRCFAFLRTVPILFDIDDAALWDLAQNAHRCEFTALTNIISQHETMRANRPAFFIVRSGKADVLRLARSGTERIVGSLTTGSYFGEVGLLTQNTPNATVRVQHSSSLIAYAFDALTFHRHIASQVLVFKLLHEREMRRKSNANRRHRLQIKDLELLRTLPGPDREYVLDQAEQRWYPERSSIIQQGSRGDRFYILLDGAVEVIRDDIVIDTLGPGDFFGETALLLNIPRNATIRVKRHALTWSITRSAFQRIVGSRLMNNPELHTEVLRRMHSLSRDAA